MTEPLGIRAIEERAEKATPGPENVSASCIGSCDSIPALCGAIREPAEVIKLAAEREYNPFEPDNESAAYLKYLAALALVEL